MSLEFLVKQWGEEAFVLSIAVVDPAPDDNSVNVLLARVGDQHVYFEAAVDLPVWAVLELAVDAIKEFIDMERF